MEAIRSDAALAHLILVWKRTPPFYKLELVDLESSVAEAFLGYARSAGSRLADSVPIPYDPEWPLKDHEYFELDEKDLPGENLFSDLDDFANLHRFDRKQLTKPRLYVVAVQTEQGNAFFGRRMAQLKVLKQKAGVFAAFWDGSTFNELTSSVATFSPDFDWVLWQGTLYVLDDKRFHAEFRDVKELMKAVADHVAAVTAVLPIHNAGLLTQRCQSNVQMAGKLKRIAETGIYKQPVATLKEYATEYSIPVTWDDDALVFDGSFENQWAILTLLDEDRTEGPVSHRKFESAAKRVL